jgi:hypothetical protein
MKKKLFISMGVAAALVVALALPAMADTITATVTVQEYASVTITDNGTGGLSWGTMTPGQDKKAEAASPSVTVAAAAENNRDVNILLSGTDFANAGVTESFAIANAYWNDVDNSTLATGMKETGIATDTVATLSASQSVDIYHWLSVPDTQAADAYTSTFTYTSS